MSFGNARRAQLSGGRYASSPNTLVATGSVISSVFHAVEDRAFLPLFSQYSRPEDAAVFVSQYKVMLSSTSSFVSVCAGSFPNFHAAKPGWTRIQAARPTGESV